MPTVFLTGASGFLGGHLLRELVQAGAEVRAMSRRSESDAAIRAGGATPVRCSLDNAASLQAALAGCDAVFHAAADTSVWRAHAARQFASNVEGTMNVVAAARQAGVRAFMHTSSVSAYSHLCRGVITEDTPQLGGGSHIAYERTKYLAEQAVRGSDLPWIVFQPTNILGPGDTQNWSRLIVMIDRGELPGVPPGLGVFADVREVARAQVRAWQLQRYGRAYLMGGEHASYLEFARQAGALLGKRTPSRATPAPVLKAFAAVLDVISRVTGKEPRLTPEGATLSSQQRRVDSSRAVSELDYVQPPLQQILRDTIAWLRDRGLVGR